MIVREVEHERSREWGTILLGIAHQVHFVISKFHVDLDELLEEKNSVVVIVDLMLSVRNVRGVRSLNWIRESVHLDPSLENLLASSVLQESNSHKVFNN